MILNKRLDHGFQRQSVPDMIIVHSMAQVIDSEPDYEAWDLLNMMKLSAHALIHPDGLIVRCRNDNEGAYHAKGFNRTSLGVEFLVEGLHTYGSFLNRIKEPDWLTDEQYESGVTLLRDWIKKYSIKQPSIMRHSDVSPGRKFDPGDGFPWDAFLGDCFS